MATRIYLFDGTLLTTVADGTLESTVSPLSIPGKGYTNYGEPVMQDILWTMTNFSGTQPPVPPLEGMLWYDKASGKLKIWKDTFWSALFLDSKTNLPYATNSFDLGSPNLRFLTVYANTVNANHFVGDPTLYRTTQTNLPDQTLTFDLGSPTFRYHAVYAQTFDGAASQARYADLAERYMSDMPLEPGDVVILGGDKEVTKTTEANDDRIFGVVSTNPAYMMNSEAGDDSTHPYVALTGRVPCKVIGQVKKGERLVSSSIIGVAERADGHLNPLAIIGRALVDKTSDDIELIEIVVGRQ